MVGLTLQQVACVLAGCADAGGSLSTRVLRQPLLLLLSQLAKIAFDSRYAMSPRLRSRIHMLYLPLVKIALENIDSLGPPGKIISDLFCSNFILSIACFIVYCVVLHTRDQGILM